jgi:hypothetical protein
MYVRLSSFKVRFFQVGLGKNCANTPYSGGSNPSGAWRRGIGRSRRRMPNRMSPSDWVGFAPPPKRHLKKETNWFRVARGCVAARPVARVEGNPRFFEMLRITSKELEDPLNVSYYTDLEARGSRLTPCSLPEIQDTCIYGNQDQQTTKTLQDIWYLRSMHRQTHCKTLRCVVTKISTL